MKSTAAMVMSGSIINVKVSISKTLFKALIIIYLNAQLMFGITDSSN